MPYQSPGGAFSNAMEEFLFQQAAQKRQSLLDSLAITREERMAKTDMETQHDARERIRQEDERIQGEREDRAIKTFDRGRTRTEEDVKNKVLGDPMTPDLLERIKRYGVDANTIAPEPTAATTIPTLRQAPAGVLPGPETIPAPIGGVGPTLSPATPYSIPPPADAPIRFGGRPIERARQKLGATIRGGADPREVLTQSLESGVDPKEMEGVLSALRPPKPAADPAATHEANRLFDIAHPLPKEPKEPSTGRLDKSYDTQTKRLDALEKPLAEQAERIGRLRATINQMSPAADALIAPELLTAIAGGIGSGLRMNEAEISRIVGGRTQWESLKSKLMAWQADSTQPFSVTPEQRLQMRSFITAIADRGQKRLSLLDDARSQLVDAPDVDTHRRVVDAVKKALNAETLETGAASSDRKPTAEELIKKYGGGR